MDHVRTTAVGISKLLLVIIYVGMKLKSGKPITDEDLVILGLGGGGFLGNLMSADAKKPE
jgi:hypothetical protein